MDFGSGTLPTVARVHSVGHGAIARVGMWLRDAALAFFTNVAAEPSPPTCPVHATFMWCYVPLENVSLLQTT